MSHHPSIALRACLFKILARTEASSSLDTRRGKNEHECTVLLTSLMQGEAQGLFFPLRLAIGSKKVV